jgi:hypothetical protein
VGARGASFDTESIRRSCSAGVNGAASRISSRGYISGSGELPADVRFVARRHARLVVLGEDLTDQFSSAAHADLVEDGLEVIPHRVWRDVELA